jgi:hypothetical protein
LLRLPGASPSLRRSGVVKRLLASRAAPPARQEGPPDRTPRPGERPCLVRAAAADTQHPSPAATQPTSVSLPGYRFVECVGQGPLGDLWLVRDARGRERRAFCLLNLVKYDEQLVAQLEALRDPVLPEAEVHWSQADRVVLVTDSFEQTLRDRFEQCQGAGLRGVPRDELLGYLRTAARALDALAARHGLAHLGLNPRNLFVDDGRLWVADFGLVALLWLPTGQPAAQVNSRYSAPELFGPGGGPQADQYSLALIYAEMLTGAHPRPPRPGSGLVRRGGSGLVSRAAQGTLDLLPQADRAAVARALDPDPAKRFPSCTALVEALEAASGATSAREELYHSLPPVVPLATLRGEPASPDVVLPAVGQLVASLTAGSESRLVPGAENVRYFVRPGGAWEYTFPVRLFPGAIPLKVEAFRQHWGARIVRRGESGFLFQIDLHTPRRFWERWAGTTRQVEVELQVDPAGALRNCLTEARVAVRPARGGDALARALAQVGPQILDSMRSYLQASPEQRSAQRVALAQPVNVYPVLPSLELAPVLAGLTRDVSATGVSFRVPQPPGAERVHLHQAPAARAFAVLARVVRVQPAGTGDFEVGAAFRRAEEEVRGEAP